MDFYRINEEYNQYLQRYEKEKRGVTKVPNIRYTDRNKFAFGAVMQVNGINYYVSVSSFDKKQEANILIRIPGDEKEIVNFREIRLLISLFCYITEEKIPFVTK